MQKSTNHTNNQNAVACRRPGAIETNQKLGLDADLRAWKKEKENMRVALRSTHEQTNAIATYRRVPSNSPSERDVSRESICDKETNAEQRGAN